MKKHRKLLTSLISALFFLANLGGTIKAQAQTPPPTPQPQPGQQPPAFDSQNPPWTTTRERIPKEVKDKEKDTVVTWCPPTSSQPTPTSSKIAYEIVYRNPNTGLTTRVRHIEKLSISTDGSREKRTVTWEITVEEANKVRKITYELADYATNPSERGHETRSEKVKGAGTAPEYREDKVKPEDLFDPTPAPPPPPPPPRPPVGEPPKPSWLQRFAPTQLANVNSGFNVLFSSATVEYGPSFRTPTILLAAADVTQPRPSGPPSQETRQEPRDNIKVVTIGGPPSEPVVVVFEQPPQTTPEQFVQNPPGSTWDPSEDPKGPNTTTGGPGGSIPMTYIPGGFVNIGSGWSSQTVPSSYLRFCSGEDDDAEDSNVPGVTIKRLPAIKGGDAGKEARLWDGSTVKVFPKYGSIELPNGTTVQRWSKGTRAITLPNGAVILVSPSEGTASFGLPDGTSIFSTKSGTRIDLPDGRSLLKRPDGTIVQNQPDGSSVPYTGQTTVKVPNGPTIDMSDKNGTIVTTPDGNRSYINTDGSLTRVELRGGDEVFAFRDGEIVLGTKGGPQIHMEKDGKTDISAISGGPKATLNTDGGIDAVPIKGGRIY